MKIICDWKNCKKPGDYKAPVERDNSRKYRLLSLEHIKRKQEILGSNMLDEEFLKWLQVQERQLLQLDVLIN